MFAAIGGEGVCCSAWDKGLTLSPSLWALREVRSLYREVVEPDLGGAYGEALLRGGEQIDFRVGEAPRQLYGRSYENEPLLWISNDNEHDYGIFKRCFDALGLADELRPHIAHDKDVILYSGFFVVGDHFDRPKWHVDYFEGASAYTLLTPLFDVEAGHGNLLYIDGSAVRIYNYRAGEAMILGEGVVHSTEPYRRNGKIRVLLSMTFGTDQLARWPVLERTIGGQSEFMILPCGHVRGACSCLSITRTGGS